MIGVDTNVLIRYLTQDDPRQSAIATRFIEARLSEENPGFVSAVTLCEIAWVLAASYGADRKRIRQTVENLLTTKQLVIEGAELVWKALRASEGGQGDFSDALIGQIAAAHGCETTVTFDRAAGKLPGFDMLST
ncbi:MAG: type II toxin-antitoxin system VapC family toxin [Betaproteobacteria bacterium]|nr:type II toxin-antitoxin system VapC family toxin [Betaproteobacteria bacterium]